jgi:hypothetical protein
MNKRELIEKFILENLPEITDTDEIVPAFEKYWNEEQQKAFDKIITEENLSSERTEKLIEEYPQYFEETIQVTTRAKRNDYDPYIFVTKDQYKKLEHQLIGRTVIKTSDGEENWYGTIFPADSNKYKIIILNKAGLEDFKAIVEKFNEVWEAQLICACNIGLINQDIDKIQQMDGRSTRDDKFIQDEIDGIKALCPEYLDVTNEYAKLEDILAQVKKSDIYMKDSHNVNPLFTKETTNE